tara:strand:+ start:181 stop:1653 length:1473 start_codon:yes stop_codon:yes gene_type:complete
LGHETGIVAEVQESSPSGIFRGWFVLAGLFVTMTVTSGLGFYAQGVFLDALVVEQGFSVSVAGAGTGIFFAVSGIAGYYAGSLLSKFDVRLVMTVGSLIGAIGLALLGQVRNEAQMVLVMVVFGIGFALTSLVPSSAIVTRWFVRKRSIALSIASSGLSLGGIAISPVIATIIDADSLIYWAPRLAIAFLIGMLPAVLFLVRPAPEALGLRPDGDPPLASGAPPPNPAGVSFKEAVRSRYFILISVTFVIVMAAQVGAIQHTFKMTKDRIDIDTARTALMVLSGTSVVARILGGIAATKISLTGLTAALMAVQSVGIAVLAVGQSKLVILIGAVILGAAMGNLLMFHPLLLADAFGVKDYPRIYGMGQLIMILGVGSGPFLVGLIRDASSYRAAFGVLTIFAVAALIFLLAAGKPTTQEIATADAAKAASAVTDFGKPPRPNTLTPPHELEPPASPPRKRIAVVDRGSVMHSNDLSSVVEPRSIPLKTSD